MKRRTRDPILVRILRVERGRRAIRDATRATAEAIDSKRASAEAWMREQGIVPAEKPR